MYILILQQWHIIEAIHNFKPNLAVILAMNHTSAGCLPDLNPLNSSKITVNHHEWLMTKNIQCWEPRKNALSLKLLKTERLSAGKVIRVRPTEPKLELDWF